LNWRQKVELARVSPSGLARLETRNWATPKHIRLLDRAVRDLEAGDYDRLIVEAPPRHGKSEECTHFFPAWYMTRNPQHDVMLFTHTDPLARFFGAQVRNTVEAFGRTVGNHGVARGTSAKDDWRLTDRGGRFLAMGAGGSPIGRGAHLMIIDDPYGSKEDAMSETIRESRWEWLTGTLRNRLEPNAKVMIIMQRWHDDDMVGRLKKIQGIRKDGGRWEVVTLPAIAEDTEFWPGTDDVFRRPGEALWEARYDEPTLREVEKDLVEWEGAYFWNAQYQQRPNPVGGGMFKDEWFQFVEVDELNGFYALLLPNGEIVRYRIADCYKFVTVDPAFSEKTTADWTVIQTWAVTPNGDLLLLDQIREHIEGANIGPRLQALARWQTNMGRIYVEAYGGGLVVAQVARNLGLPVVDLNVPGDKRIRAMPLQARMAAGRVYFRKDAPWFRVLRDEFLVFDQGRHDDQVDAAAYAAQVLLEEGTGRVHTIKHAVR
jgi:predicted phage terminase large subunit-like protein